MSKTAGTARPVEGRKRLRHFLTRAWEYRKLAAAAALAVLGVVWSGLGAYDAYSNRGFTEHRLVMEMRHNLDDYLGQLTAAKVRHSELTAFYEELPDGGRKNAAAEEANALRGRIASTAAAARQAEKQLAALENRTPRELSEFGVPKQLISAPIIVSLD